jgi:hypothetical protein
LPLALNRTTDAFGVGRIQVGHVVRHVDSQRSNLRNEILGRQIAFFGQLIDTNLPALPVAARISSIKSASNHRDLPTEIDRSGAQCARVNSVD